MMILNGRRMDDVLPPRSIEDDILFQKIKTLPKQSRHYRVHRRLTWQCTRNIQHLEKSNKLTTVELDRSKSKVVSKLQEIRNRRQDIIASGRHSRLLLRKGSAPLPCRSVESASRSRAKSTPNIKDMDVLFRTEVSTPRIETEFSRLFRCRREQSELVHGKDKTVTISKRERTFAHESHRSGMSTEGAVRPPPKNILGLSPEPSRTNTGSPRRFTLPIISPLPMINSV